MNKTETTWIFWVVRIRTQDLRTPGSSARTRSNMFRRHCGGAETVLRVDGAEESQEIVKESERSSFLEMMFKKVMMALNSDLGEETARMTERMVVLRIATKHINLWVRQLEMKRREICELAGLIGLQEVKKEISEEKSMERWARRCSKFFTKKVKRTLFEEIDNMVWSGNEKEITG